MKHALLLIVLQLASSGADAYYTNRIMEHPWGFELNPVAKPFVGSRAGRITYFSVTAGAKIALPIALRRHGHEKLASIAAWSGIADNAGGAGYSAERLWKAKK